MFAAEPAVGRTSSLIPASGATNLARSAPIAKYVPFSLAVTILYSAAASAAPLRKQTAAVASVTMSFQAMSFPPLWFFRIAQTERRDRLRARLGAGRLPLRCLAA